MSLSMEHWWSLWIHEGMGYSGKVVCRILLY